MSDDARFRRIDPSVAALMHREDILMVGSVSSEGNLATLAGCGQFGILNRADRDRLDLECILQCHDRPVVSDHVVGR